MKHKNPYIYNLVRISKRTKNIFNNRFKKRKSYYLCVKKLKPIRLFNYSNYKLNLIRYRTTFDTAKYMKKFDHKLITYKYLIQDKVKTMNQNGRNFKHNLSMPSIFLHKNITSNDTLRLSNHSITSKSFFNLPMNYINSKNCFIFNNGLFLMFMFSFQSWTQSVLTFKFKWKKKLYSFLKPNEYRKSIFLKKRKSLVSRFS